MDRIPPNRYFVFGLLASLSCAIDLYTKHLMFAWPLLRSNIYWVWPEYAGFQTSLNEGALFGMGQGGQMWFALMSLIAAVAIPVWLFKWRAAHDWWLTVALGGIMGGVLGNLYDRLGLHGLKWAGPPNRVGDQVYAVRDWILLQWSNDARWPNFNIADSLLVVGAVILFVRTLTTPENPQVEQDTESKK